MKLNEIKNKLIDELKLHNTYNDELVVAWLDQGKLTNYVTDTLTIEDVKNMKDKKFMIF